MWPYFAMSVAAAAIVGAGTLLGRRAPEKYRKSLVVGTYILAGAMFCFFAGARARSVGFDVNLYAWPSFNEASGDTFAGFFTTSSYASWGPLVKAILWITAHATQSFFCYLFVIQLCLVAPMFATIRLMLKDNGYWAVFLFGILIFPVTLCFMRQAMAMGFVFLSIVFVRDRKPALFAFAIIAAVLLHSTAIVSLFIYPIYLLGTTQKWSMPVKLAGVTVIAVLGMLALPALIDALALVAGHYGGYLDGSWGGDYGLIKLTSMLVGIFVGLGTAYFYCLKRSQPQTHPSPVLSGLALIVYIGVLLNLLGCLSWPLYRLFLYYAMFAILLIPAAIAQIKKRPERTIFEAIAITGMCVLSVCYYVVLPNNLLVVPFVLA